MSWSNPRSTSNNNTINAHALGLGIPSIPSLLFVRPAPFWQRIQRDRAKRPMVYRQIAAALPSGPPCERPPDICYGLRCLVQANILRIINWETSEGDAVDTQWGEG